MIPSFPRHIAAFQRGCCCFCHGLRHCSCGCFCSYSYQLFPSSCKRPAQFLATTWERSLLFDLTQRSSLPPSSLMWIRQVDTERRELAMIPSLPRHIAAFQRGCCCFCHGLRHCSCGCFCYHLFLQETGAVLGHDLGEELALWPDPEVKLGSLQLDVDQAGRRREERAGNDSLVACTYWRESWISCCCFCHCLHCSCGCFCSYSYQLFPSSCKRPAQFLATTWERSLLFDLIQRSSLGPSSLMWIRQVDAERRELAMIPSLPAHIGGEKKEIKIITLTYCKS